jgi:two-component system chemotaxis response regulator CheB
VITAGNGKDALKKLAHGKFFLIISDMMMPEMDGLSFCQEAKALMPDIPFIMITGFIHESLKGQSGSCIPDAMMEKPYKSDQVRRLVKTFERARMSRIAASKIRPGDLSEVDAILIGGSTGATNIVADLLKKMPPYSPPIVLVQHIPPNFANPFAERLAKISTLKYNSGNQEEMLKKGHLYMASGDNHIGIKSSGDSLIIFTSSEEKINGHRPSVDFLFRTAAASKCKRFISIILTGMGRDLSLEMVKFLKVLSYRNKGSYLSY